MADDLTNGYKIKNISDLRIADYVDKDDLQLYLSAGKLKEIEVIFHLGACSSTTEWNGNFLMKNNFEYSKELFHWAQINQVPFIYASSASVYGLGVKGFSESESCEQPINAYAYSKLIFDQYVRRHMHKSSSQVVGLRYFNVYGPREGHKGNMVSPAFSFFSQAKETGIITIFEGSHGYLAGEHRRDFVHVSDCADINLWFYENDDVSGIFNVGTGKSASFNDVAAQIIKNMGSGEIEYVTFPSHLQGHYQSFTEANINALRRVGYDNDFMDIERGIYDYCCWLKESGNA